MTTTIDNMVPGEYQDASVTIKNTGDVPGDFYLEAVNMRATPKGIARYLELTIAKNGKTSTTARSPASRRRNSATGPPVTDTRTAST